MENQIIIYVAGNPNAYPLEYYEEETDSYQGVIPYLLEQFSAQSDYEIRYYPTDGKDQRSHLAENLQVDLLSGYQEGDVLPVCMDQVTVFRTETHGYFVCLTQSAPQNLKKDLENFCTSVSQEEISSVLMESQMSYAESGDGWLLISGLILMILLFASAILLTIRYYRKKLCRVKENGDTDTVTGLGNFDYLSRYYRQVVNNQNRILYSLLYFYVDTDRIRLLGGSQETDDFLRYCAVTLQEYASDTDVLAKISDQGFVLLKFAVNKDSVLKQMNFLLGKIRAYSQTCGKTFEVNMTVGIYDLKSDDWDLNEMIFNASQAAHAAWRNHKDYMICEVEMQQKITEERMLQSSVDQALEHHLFQLYLQFYVDINTFQIIGGEALSRWNHPQKGLLMPKVFIPLLEREGLISKLDYYCLAESCRFLETLWKKGVDDFFVSCNFSRETFAVPDFAERCKEIIGLCSFPKEMLFFELTESASENNDLQIKQNMVALKEYGVRVALDDFGVGFTSFSDLQQYPVDGIKLDKGLVDNIMTKNGAAILRAMVQVGHELDMIILAEGVEREEQVQALRKIQCDAIQGFQFYKPLPAIAAQEKILKQYSKKWQ